MSEGRLVRRLLPFERGFAQLPNSWMRDRELSLKARGLLALLMTFEDGFNVSIAQLERDGHGGYASISTAVVELEKAGYLVRRPRRKGGRFTADDWELVDPTGMSDPALFGGGSAYPQARADRPRKSGTAPATVPENRGRTVPENRGAEEDLKNTPKDLPSATPVRARGDEPCAGGCGQPWRFQPSQSYGLCARCVAEPGWHLHPTAVTR
ncbi:hypothetical protein [Protaetiibacter larvae]|uniref:Helix-turn-helix domain-containing protein n=1 Tax=Protaetiibacter larvae TaxID=2592654 RepID=A0A5C1Y6F5_9MICO|nr:hypothetical protein [Protaetiibacter larvae]QEO08899.1 hypothetical protein FLP23_01990 [Protaetiibacter larvae]